MIDSGFEGTAVHSSHGNERSILAVLGSGLKNAKTVAALEIVATGLWAMYAQHALGETDDPAGEVAGNVAPEITLLLKRARKEGYDGSQLLVGAQKIHEKYFC